ncbi:MAG TPA: hypothetical protein VHZ54_02640 [Solirubrobacterales bacterium]|jgi:hypothetical protein|nr:hypothetical protein [Solirubrobacterales bacterium]
MKRLNLTLALGAVALLALSGIAVAKDRHGDDNGHHGRHHHHHQFPMREAGTISSFDTATGRLTIALTDGETVTGLVTDRTEIKCEGVDDRRDRRDHGGDTSGPGSGGDNGGRGEPEPGDDHGGPNEPGDNNGGEAPTVPAPVPGEASCSLASLTPGEVVGEAELRLEGGAAVFEEVELGFHS